MTNKELIEKFYTSFSNKNPQEMASCYHKEITFQDPAFGKLKGVRSIKMWEMLLSQKNSNTTISFDNILANKNEGSATWVAHYVYGDKKRKVTNKVKASFKFKEGKIIEHIDSFNLWNWSQQALGLMGFVLGWTPFMKNKIQKTTNTRLDIFINKNRGSV